MGFYCGTIQVSSVDDFLQQLHSKLIAAGWTDISGATPPPYKAQSAADAKGRYAYVELNKETVTTTDYPLIKVSSQQDFAANVIQRGLTTPNSGSTFPMTFEVYANEWWFFVVDTSDYFKTAMGGLYDPPSDVTAQGHPNNVFIVGDRIPAATTSNGVTFFQGVHQAMRVINTTGTEEAAGFAPFQASEYYTFYEFSTPKKRMALQPWLGTNIAWYGWLPYAVVVFGTQLNPGDAVNIDGVYYTALKTHSNSTASLCVRTS